MAEAAHEWASLCETFRSALNLSYVESKKDPDTEPYRSKYSARELLEGLKQLLGAGEAGEAEGARGPGEEEGEGEGRRRAVRLAVVEYELGVNHTDTQECSAGEEHLAKCLQLLERHRFSRECVSLYIQAQVREGPPILSRPPGPDGTVDRGEPRLGKAAKTSAAPGEEAGGRG